MPISPALLPCNHEKLHSDEMRTASRRRFSKTLSSSRASISSIDLSLEIQPIEKSNPAKKQMESRLSGFTINKLKTNSIGLVGREKETKILKRSLHRMMEEHRQKAAASKVSVPTNKLVHSEIRKEVVFISGFSGVGKTSVAESIQDAVKDTEHGLFVQGKFDLHKGKDQPYSAIAKAYGHILRHLKEQRAEDTLSFTRELYNMVAPREIEALANLIPELDEIVDVSISAHDTSDGVDRRGERWKYAFRALTRLLTARIIPLVICIDDLHWSDDESLALIQHFIDDIQNPNPLMVIGCYRSNEVDDSSKLSTMIQYLEESSAAYGFNMTRLNVSNCGFGDVNTIMMQMMSVDDEQKTLDLAELCFRRTQGNPFFLLEFMAMLNRENLLTFNLGTMSWMYSVKDIEGATESTLNVVALLHSRMQNLSTNVQDLLRGAACLGPSFRSSTLHTIWTRVLNPEDACDSIEVVDLMLLEAKEAMLIESCGDGRYRWVHDKVQEAALSLTKSHRKTFMFEIGKVLYQYLSAKELEEELFEVVDLLNSACELKQREFAELNLRAAKKARQVSAFRAALTYSSKGIAMMHGNAWVDHRQLALDLHILAAELAYVLGNLDEMEHYCTIVFGRNDFTLDEVFPLRVLRINASMSSNMRYDIATEYCLVLLEEMGFKFPAAGSYRLKEKLHKSFPTLVSHPSMAMAKKTIKALGQKPQTFYSSRPMMADEKCKKICYVLMKLSNASYGCGKYYLSELTSCAVAKFLMEHGLCQASSYALAALGTSTLMYFQDYATSRHLSEMSLFAQERIGEGNATATQYVAYQFGLVWTTPYHQNRDVFYPVYLSGVSNGETDYSMWCLFGHLLLMPWILGTAIDQILEDCSKFVVQLTQINQHLKLVGAKCFQQMLLNMSRRECPNRTRLDGDVFDREKIVGKGNIIVSHQIHLAECRLMLVYDRQALADLAVVHGDRYPKLNPGTFQVMDETLHRGLALYSVARKTKNISKKWKYAKHAKKVRKTIQKWVKAGNPNAPEYAVVFDAEHAALDGKRKKAEKNYQKAITFAARTGHLHHAALYNELYAEFLWHNCNELEEAKYRWEESIRFYEEWGALGKVDLLRASIRELSFSVVKGVLMEMP